MMIQNSKLYDGLKYFAMVFLPALTVFVGVCMKAINMPNVDIVVTIMTAFDTFLGAILKVSSDNYYKE